MNDKGDELWLWIQVQSWHEGLVASTIAFSQLVDAAKELNATLV
jgi:hypothetical protein